MDLLKQNIDWPKVLGTPTKLNALFGMGQGRVFELEFPEFSAIAKVSPLKTEREFYELLAPKLKTSGVDTPKLLWSTIVSGQHLIVLEKIQMTLPESRWRADNDVLRFLARMHEVKIPTSEMVLKPDHWTQEMNINSRGFFRPSDQDYVFELFERLRLTYNWLFEPRHLISGDPSGRNWGVRENGDLVLFDWERVGLGTSALDLMGVAFGEPEDKVFLEIARLYLQHRPAFEHSAQDLARETQVARVHIAAVILDTHTKGEGHLSEKLLPYFKEQFPDWLRKVFG